MAELKLTQQTFKLGDESVWSKKKIAPDRVGSPTREDIWLAVGRALTIWDDVESRVIQLVLILTNQNPSDNGRSALVRVLGAIEGFRAKLDAIDFAAPIYFAKNWEDKRIRTEFSKVRRTLTAAARIRNDIAHGVAVCCTSMVNSSDNSVKTSGWFLCASQYNARQRKTEPSIQADMPRDVIFSEFCFSHEDIDDYMLKFLHLGNVMHSFLSSLRRTSNGVPGIVDAFIQADEKAADEKKQLGEAYKNSHPGAQFENIDRQKQRKAKKDQV